MTHHIVLRGDHGGEIDRVEVEAHNGDELAGAVSAAVLAWTLNAGDTIAIEEIGR